MDPELPLASPPAFPFRVAAIDIGSNAIRFAAAEFTAPDTFELLRFLREPIRLGHDVFRKGKIGGALRKEAIAALGRMREEMDGLGVSGYRAVATSAVRDSENGEKFVKRVWREVGVRVDTITGEEEARLVWLAARARMAPGKGRSLLVDLGGGSLEISVADGKEVRSSESYPLGTVRLIEELGAEGAQSPDAVRRHLDGHAAMKRISAIAGEHRQLRMVATGGNMEELAILAGSEREAREPARIPVETLSALVDRLAALSPAERVKELGLRADRADVILPAAVVYERIAQLLGAREFVAPKVGVKEGLLMDVADDLLGPGALRARPQRDATAAAVELARRYEHDAPHAEQVARLALALFDQLRELHGLGESDRRILLAAALLHDIGKHIAAERHHKHSRYLIENAELAAFTEAETRLIALVARYHRGAEPAEKHQAYGKLSTRDRERVERLAALLRIADALDHRPDRRIAKLTAAIEGKKLVIAPDRKAIPEVDDRAVRRKGKLFERLFGLRVRLAGAEAEE